MKRGSLLLICAACLTGQSGREAYREAYQNWRQAAPNLERDAASGGATLAPQADRAAVAAANFGAARAAFLRSASQEMGQRLQLLRTATVRLSSDPVPATTEQLIAAETKIVANTIARFANDRDRGIQQLRQSLQRERESLEALNEAVQVRKKSTAKTADATAALEQARLKAAEAYSPVATQVAQAAAQLEKESTAWADYYEKLAVAVQTSPAPGPGPAIVAANAPAAPRTDSVAKVPLARYVGAWTFPTSNGLFHGAQPEFVDLVVHEQSGRADGTLYARFKLPAGSTGDPILRFDFQGEFGPAVNQRFPLVTSDGTSGTIELIPGPAFNLLEVNFQTDPKADKVRTGNFILVKR